jgi:hypothetical protein
MGRSYSSSSPRLGRSPGGARRASTENGRPPTLGLCPDVGLAEARAMKQEKRGLIARGIDPKGARGAYHQAVPTPRAADLHSIRSVGGRLSPCAISHGNRQLLTVAPVAQHGFHRNPREGRISRARQRRVTSRRRRRSSSTCALVLGSPNPSRDPRRSNLGEVQRSPVLALHYESGAEEISITFTPRSAGCIHLR